MDDHVVLGVILGIVAASNLFFGVWIVWLVRDTSLTLARLVIITAMKRRAHARAGRGGTTDAAPSET